MNMLSDDLEFTFSRICAELAGGISCRVIVEGQPRMLRSAVRDEAYRIGLEALRNASQHSAASSIEIEIEYGSARFCLFVRDDGKGMTPQSLGLRWEDHRGLSEMRSRAERIGGKLRLSSRIGAGTEIEFTVPHHIAFVPAGEPARFKWLTAIRP